MEKLKFLIFYFIIGFPEPIRSKEEEKKHKQAKKELEEFLRKP